MNHRHIFDMNVALRVLALALALAFTSTIVQAQITSGSRVQVSTLPNFQTTNVRNAPAGDRIGSQPDGALGYVTGSPQTASLSGTSYTWWYVDFDFGDDGWVASVALIPAGSSDLIPQNISVPTSVTASEQFTVSWQIRNAGSAAADASSTTVVRINQSTTSAAGTNLESVSTSALSAGTKDNQSVELTAPSSPGVYYIWVIADNFSKVTNQSDENNDLQRSGAITVEEPASSQPVLSVTPSSPGTLSAASGSLSLNVSNSGAGTMNYSASVTNGSSWLSITSGGSGTNNGTINLGYAANTGGQRSGTIRVTASGTSGSPVDFSVTQRAAEQTNEQTDESSVWPVQGYTQISSSFFDSAYSVQQERQHLGLDIPAPIDTPVLAPVSGTVYWKYINESDSSQSMMVIQERKGGVLTGRYVVIGHVGYPFGSLGDTLRSLPEDVNVTGHDIQISAGSIIGKILPATGGISTGAHVHIGLRTSPITRKTESWPSGTAGWGRAPEAATRAEAETRGWLDPAVHLYSQELESPSTSSPSVSTTSPGNITQTSVTLNGSANPNGSDTTIYFEYGIAPEYDRETSSSGIGSGTSSSSFSIDIVGLSCGTAYNYRAVAVNAGGSVNGSGRSFTTLSCSVEENTLKVSKTGTGSGEILSGPEGVDCESGCASDSAEFAGGTNVLLRATPFAGSEFSGWSGDCTGFGLCSLIMNQDHNVTAIFSLIDASELSNDEASASIITKSYVDNPDGIPGKSTGKTISLALFQIGASGDQGESLKTTFAAGEEVVIVGAVEPQPEDLGKPAEIFVVLMTISNFGSVVSYLGLDGDYHYWDGRGGNLNPAYEVESLEDLHVIGIFDGQLVSGTHLVFIGYRVIGESGALHYTAVPMLIFVI